MAQGRAGSDEQCVHCAEERRQRYKIAAGAGDVECAKAAEHASTIASTATDFAAIAAAAAQADTHAKTATEVVLQFSSLPPSLSSLHRLHAQPDLTANACLMRSCLQGGFRVGIAWC